LAVLAVTDILYNIYWSDNKTISFVECLRIDFGTVFIKSLAWCFSLSVGSCATGAMKRSSTHWTDFRRPRRGDSYDLMDFWNSPDFYFVSDSFSTKHNTINCVGVSNTRDLCTMDVKYLHVSGKMTLEIYIQWKRSTSTCRVKHFMYNGWEVPPRVG
jgi:hypothetical protein